MNTLTTLRDFDRISAFLLYVSLFFLALSAYKRTKQKGFVFWGFAAIGYLLNSPMPFQPSRGYPAAHGYSSRLVDVMHCLGIVNNTLMLVGIVLIVKSYVELFNARNVTEAKDPPIDSGSPESRDERCSREE
ncbi:MAG: hypothetical protein P4L99_26350 [Chthoniobacter sp.]|nr:hypothetical protein [Chthoniobacter sp.]